MKKSVKLEKPKKKVRFTHIVSLYDSKGLAALVRVTKKRRARFIARLWRSQGFSSLIEVHKARHTETLLARVKFFRDGVRKALVYFDTDFLAQDFMRLWKKRSKLNTVKYRSLSLRKVSRWLETNAW